MASEPTSAAPIESVRACLGEETGEARKRNKYGLQLRLGYRLALERCGLHFCVGLEGGGGALQTTAFAARRGLLASF